MQRRTFLGSVAAVALAPLGLFRRRPKNVRWLVEVIVGGRCAFIQQTVDPKFAFALWERKSSHYREVQKLFGEDVTVYLHFLRDKEPPVTEAYAHFPPASCKTFKWPSGEGGIGYDSLKPLLFAYSKRK